MVLAFCSRSVLCRVELSLHGEEGRLTEPAITAVMLCGGGLNRQGALEIMDCGFVIVGGGGGSMRERLLGWRDGDTEGGLSTGGFTPTLGCGSEMLRLKLSLRLSRLRAVVLAAAAGGSLNMLAADDLAAAQKTFGPEAGVERLRLTAAAEV